MPDDRKKRPQRYAPTTRQLEQQLLELWDELDRECQRSRRFTRKILRRIRALEGGVTVSKPSVTLT